MGGLQTKFLAQEFAYDGTQLRSLFAYLEHRVQGDSVVSWVGPCSISFDHMVDGEDVLAGASIAGSRMVHFIVELFHQPLFAAVAVQRLFASIVLDLVREQVRDPKLAASLRRDGDDIYFNAGSGEGKFSISIATVSPVSSLIHFAVNISNKGTPVKTASLEDLGLDAQAFAESAMARLANEIESVKEATVKVRWVQ
jgi:hypothetical protein